MENWSGEALIAIASAVLSLVFGLLPAAKRWFETHITDDYKPLFMGGILFVISVVNLLFSNLAVWPAWSLPVFDWAGVWADLPLALTVLLAAFGANQGAYLAFVKPKKDNFTYYHDLDEYRED